MAVESMSLMSKIPLNSGTQIPLLGFGTYLTKGSTATKATLYALQHGYRHIDTASIYRNESDIAKAIEQSGIKREDIFITSKLNPSEQGYEQALQAFKDTTEKLRVTYLDLYLIHWPGVKGVKKESDKHKEKRKQSWLALEKLFKEGKCKAIGVSNFNISHLEQLIEDVDVSIVPAVNQCECHPRLTQVELRKYCKEKGIVFEAYSSLGSGELIGDPKIKTIAEKYKKTTAQVLLRWGIQHDLVVIPKSVHETRIVENADVFDFTLSDEDMKYLDSLNKNYHTCWDPTGLP